MTKKFILLGKGNYNEVYLVKENNVVIGVVKEQTTTEPLAINKNDPDIQELIALEEQTHISISLDTTERSLKIWNEINPSRKAHTIEINIGGTTKEMCLYPYIQGRQANDAEIVNTLLDIYQRTGRIVVDGMSRGNILTQDDGISICVDVGMAIKLDNRYGPFPRVRDTEKQDNFDDMPGLLQWRSLQLSRFEPYFAHKYFKQYPLSLNVIKSLLFLNRHRPDIHNVEFLKNPGISDTISQAYTKELTDPLNAYRLIYQANVKIAQHDANQNNHFTITEQSSDITQNDQVDVANLKHTITQYKTHLKQKMAEVRLDDKSPMIKNLLKRDEIIVELYDLIHSKSPLNEEDITSAKNAIGNCLNTRPDWEERPFIQSLTDILSLPSKQLYLTFFPKQRSGSKNSDHKHGVVKI